MIDPTFNATTWRMARMFNPSGWIVRHDGPAPTTLAELREAYAATGKIVLHGGNSDHTIYGDRETNYAARAWHDAAHLELGAEFDLAGETMVCHFQQTQLWTNYGLACPILWHRLLEAEFIGQLGEERATGSFPADQLAFTLKYLKRFK